MDVGRVLICTEGCDWPNPKIVASWKNVAAKIETKRLAERWVFTKLVVFFCTLLEGCCLLGPAMLSNRWNKKIYFSSFLTNLFWIFLSVEVCLRMASFCSLYGFFSSLLFLSKYQSKVFLRRSNRFWTTKILIPRSKLVCWLAKVVESAITINKNGFSSSPFAKTVLLNYSMKVWIDGALFLVVFSSGIISDFVPKLGMFLGWTREKINSSSDFFWIF